MKLARRFFVASVALAVMVVAPSFAAPKASNPSAPPQAPPAAPRRFDNAVIHVEVSGKGAPIVFIPGLASSGEVYRDAVARYAGHYECHVVTLGGFGGQPRFDGPFMDTARESLQAYIRARHLDHPVIVGHSLGGVLALELAIAAPDAIGPLVVLDALPFLGGAGQPAATSESVGAQMAPMRKMIADETQEAYVAFQKQSPYLHSMVTRPADFDRVLGWAVASDHHSVADGMYEVATTDLRGRMSEIRSPLLVLGTWYGLAAFSTREVVEGHFREQFAAVPHWTFATADSAKHFLMLDDPEWTWSKVDSFLASQDSRRTHAGDAR